MPANHAFKRPAAAAKKTNAAKVGDCSVTSVQSVVAHLNTVQQTIEILDLYDGHVLVWAEFRLHANTIWSDFVLFMLHKMKRDKKHVRVIPGMFVNMESAWVETDHLTVWEVLSPENNPARVERPCPNTCHYARSELDRDDWKCTEKCVLTAGHGGRCRCALLGVGDHWHTPIEESQQADNPSQS
jgi:hypothetical protein